MRSQGSNLTTFNDPTVTTHQNLSHSVSFWILEYLSVSTHSAGRRRQLDVENSRINIKCFAVVVHIFGG